MEILNTPFQIAPSVTKSGFLSIYDNYQKEILIFHQSSKELQKRAETIVFIANSLRPLHEALEILLSGKKPNSHQIKEYAELNFEIYRKAYLK